MRIRYLPKPRYLFLILAFAFTCSVRAAAQDVRFVQITDPHLFDAGQEGTDNRAAFSACIQKINERVAEQGNYDFAVLTGDLGIEDLVSIIAANGEKFPLTDEATIERQIDEGAAVLASILSPAKIRVWLFLPGNNDLFKEELNTKYYRLFFQKLKQKLPGLGLIDLCPEEPSVDKLQLGVHRIGSLGFIGFNNASFKNNNEFGRISENKKTQLKYVEQVARRVNLPDISAAFVFYHIPETDDPHIVLNADTKAPTARKGYADNPYPDSSWFVDKDVHRAWKETVVKNTKVLGLFAGHLHDWRRETYSGSISKLHVCPPLAVKVQNDKPSQARGFQEVTIDGTGTIARSILWFDPANRSFDTEPSAYDNQLRLGVFYERAHDWSEAETHFAEAAKNAQSTSGREAALAGLTRVRSARPVWLTIALGWTDPTFLAPFVLRPLAIVGFILVGWIIVMAVREGSRGMVIHAFEGDDDLAKLLAVGFPAARARVVTTLGVGHRVFLPQNVIAVYPFISPGLDELLPQESFEVAGIKVPNLNMLIKLLVRPRFQVTGGISNLSVKKYVYAEIWRRKLWFGTRLATLSTREIPFGYAGSVEVENFIFDVYLKTHATL